MALFMWLDYRLFGDEETRRAVALLEGIGGVTSGRTEAGEVR